MAVVGLDERFYIMNWFPINFEKLRGIPINRHPGAFGCPRKHDIHTGIDLYGDEGDLVRAIADGTVVRNNQFTGAALGFPFWLDTDAVLVKSQQCFYLYGELKSELKEGDEVKSGSIIGRLVPVLPFGKIRLDIAGHSNVMLHLEKYDLTYDPNKQYNSGLYWPSWELDSLKHSFLQDPTMDLISILQNKNQSFKFLWEK